MMNNERRPDGDRPPDENPNDRYRQMFRRSWLWILLAILLFFAYRLFINPPNAADNLLGLNEVAEYVRNGSAQRIVVQGDDVIVEISDSDRRRSRKESGESILESLKTLGVTDDQMAAIPIDIERAPNSGAFFNWLIMLLPMILIFGFFVFIMRQAGAGGQNRAMQFGRSRAKKMEEADRPTVTFEDVAGSEESKQELQEVVEFLKEPEKFAALGARIPKGVLMSVRRGQARRCWPRQWRARPARPFSALAAPNSSRCSSASAPAACATFSSRPRRTRPCIIFIDEIDAVGRHRGAGHGRRQR